MSADPRPMTLNEQAYLLELTASRWTSPKDGDGMAGSPVWLRAQDIEDFRTIAKTLRVMALHGADEYVRQKVTREKRDRGRR